MLHGPLTRPVYLSKAEVRMELIAKIALECNTLHQDGYLNKLSLNEFGYYYIHLILSIYLMLNFNKNYTILFLKSIAFPSCK